MLCLKCQGNAYRVSIKTSEGKNNTCTWVNFFHLENPELLISSIFIESNFYSISCVPATG